MSVLLERHEPPILRSWKLAERAVSVERRLATLSPSFLLPFPILSPPLLSSPSSLLLSPSFLFPSVFVVVAISFWTNLLEGLI